MQILKFHKLMKQKWHPTPTESHRIKRAQIYNLRAKLLHLHNPYYPPKKDLLTSGSFNNSFPVPENLFSPVTKT